MNSGLAGLRFRTPQLVSGKRRWRLCCLWQRPAALYRTPARPGALQKLPWKLTCCLVRPGRVRGVLFALAAVLEALHASRGPPCRLSLGADPPPLFCVEKTPAFLHSCSVRGTHFSAAGQTAPPVTPKLESPSSFAHRGSTRTCCFWSAASSQPAPPRYSRTTRFWTEQIPPAFAGESPFLSNLCNPGQTHPVDGGFDLPNTFFPRADSTAAAPPDLNPGFDIGGGIA